MSLVTARSYGPPWRMGKTKQLEAAGSWKGLLEHMALLSEAHGDHEEATRLRAQTSQTVTAWSGREDRY